MPTEIPGSVPWVIGILIAVVLALAGVIAYLFKLNNSRTLEHEKQRREVDLAHAAEREKWTEERASWDTERDAENARLALTYEQKHRELAESYIELAQRDRTDHLAREEQIRRDNGDLMEKVAAQANAASASMVTLLQKMHERFQGGTRRRGG